MRRRRAKVGWGGGRGREREEGRGVSASCVQVLTWQASERQTGGGGEIASRTVEEVLDVERGVLACEDVHLEAPEREGGEPRVVGRADELALGQLDEREAETVGVAGHLEPKGCLGRFPLREGREERGQRSVLGGVKERERAWRRASVRLGSLLERARRGRELLRRPLMGPLAPQPGPARQPPLSTSSRKRPRLVPEGPSVLPPSVGRRRPEGSSVGSVELQMDNGDTPRHRYRPPTRPPPFPHSRHSPDSGEERESREKEGGGEDRRS